MKIRGASIAAVAVMAAVISPAAGQAATSYPQSDESDGACTFNTDGVLDTNNNTYTGMTGNIGDHGVFNCTTLTITAETTITTVGVGILDFRATGDVDIAGTIDVSGAPGNASAGGDTGQFTAGGASGGGGGGAGFAGADGGGPSGGRAPGGSFGGGAGGGVGGGGGGGGYSGGGGGGGSGFSPIGSSPGGNGGGTGGLGGSSGHGGGGAGAPGATAGSDGTTGGGGGGGGGFSATALELHTGSGGGGGGSGTGTSLSDPGRAGGGGGGGGAVRIVTPGTIIIHGSGAISANGGSGGIGVGGTPTGGGGGGGSGGDIYLAAPIVDLPGTISAHGGIGGVPFSGGGGAGGNGGPGRIRIFANTLMNFSPSNPAATTADYGYTLSVIKDGTGGGTVSSSPSGINCGGDCSDPYDPDTPVTLSATPDPGSDFAGWSGDCSGSGACQVTMDQARSVTATFADVAPPNTSITAGPSGPTKDSTPTFAFISSELGSTFKCRVDMASFTSCTSPRTTGQLADGAHTFYVQAKDAAGNPDSTPAHRSFKVDTHRPASKASSPTSTHSSPFTVRYTVSDPSPSSGIASVELWARKPGQTSYSKAATDTTPATPSFSYKPTVGRGTYRFYTRARDKAGNYELPPSSPDTSTAFSP